MMGRSDRTSGYGAVGSAPALGAGGRGFKSRYPDGSLSLLSVSGRMPFVHQIVVLPRSLIKLSYLRVKGQTRHDSIACVRHSSEAVSLRKRIIDKHGLRRTDRYWTPSPVGYSDRISKPFKRRRSCGTGSDGTERIPGDVWRRTGLSVDRYCRSQLIEAVAIFVDDFSGTSATAAIIVKSIEQKMRSHLSVHVLLATLVGMEYASARKAARAQGTL